VLWASYPRFWYCISYGMSCPLPLFTHGLYLQYVSEMNVEIHQSLPLRQNISIGPDMERPPFIFYRSDSRDWRHISQRGLEIGGTMAAQDVWICRVSYSMEQLFFYRFRFILHIWRLETYLRVNRNWRYEMVVAQDEWICRVVVPLALAEETNVQRALSLVFLLTCSI
jgi:hypothetical protein